MEESAVATVVLGFAQGSRGTFQQGRHIGTGVRLTDSTAHRGLDFAVVVYEASLTDCLAKPFHDIGCPPGVGIGKR